MPIDDHQQLRSPNGQLRQDWTPVGFMLLIIGLPFVCLLAEHHRRQVRLPNQVLPCSCRQSAVESVRPVSETVSYIRA